MEKIEKIRKFLDDKKIDCLFTKNPSNIFYITGFLDIEGYLLIDKNEIFFFTSPLYIYESLDSSRYNKNLKSYIIKDKTFEKFLSRYKKIGFIKTEISYFSFKNIQKQIKSKLIPIDDIFLELRKIKDQNEISYIKKAQDITEKTIKKIKEEIKEGIKELDIVAEIKYQLIKNGARKEAFEPIVASGVHSSYPHHKSKNKEIKNGEVIVIDIGADFFGYKSDLTRTFFCGNVDNEILKVYKIVKETKNICTELAENKNIKANQVYQKAVENFKKYNIEKFFLHGLGHGVGIDVHEKPYLNKKSKDKIEKGNVFTIEPGIYINKKFGIRLESMIFKKT
ncbi:MAG: Xaa-Pro peptidase family protein [Candidatus Omnitrophica bacterium]|nr:Xaa-Pro peptidase family protein [Candidatus Omnitrophota bacterium]MCM8803384.1 Xaa-Pro peptidase family protein [Candidatus Omnitrophota bacterium]